MKSPKWLLFIDICLIATSIILALFLVQSNVFITLLTATKELEVVGIFIAGFFFTSVFSTAPAIVTLGEIAQVNSLFLTAFIGALGAVFGDLLIFRFVKDHLTTHILEIVKKQKGLKRFKHLLKLRSFRIASFVVGGLIIASPFPDELGIGLLGFSKLNTVWFIPLSFVFNFIGILLVGLTARALI